MEGQCENRRRLAMREIACFKDHVFFVVSDFVATVIHTHAIHSFLTSALETERGAGRVVNLTLRRLMSYIYMEHPFLMFLDHTQRRSTVGRTPLDE